MSSDDKTTTTEKPTTEKPTTEKPTEKPTTEAASETTPGEFMNTMLAGCALFPNDYGSTAKVYDNSTVGKVLDKMIGFRLSSLPVEDHATGKVVWIVSVNDVVDLVLSHFDDEDAKQTFSAKILHWLSNEGSQLEKYTVYDLMVRSQKHSVHPALHVSSDKTIMRAAKHMIRHKANHCVIYDKESKKLVSVLSMSRILKLLDGLIDRAPYESKTLQELQLGSPFALSCHPTELVYHVFKRMLSKKIPTMAVVDDLGKLKGVVSVSDFKQMHYDHKYFEMLGMTVDEYLQALIKNTRTSRIRPAAFFWLAETDAAISIPADTSLSCALHVLAYYGLHHVFLVDKAHRPIGVVSARDLVTEIVRQETLLSKKVTPVEVHSN